MAIVVEYNISGSSRLKTSMINLKAEMSMDTFTNITTCSHYDMFILRQADICENIQHCKSIHYVQ